MKRRTFLSNGILLFAAPAIVKAENIMKIASPPTKDIQIEIASDISFAEFQKLILRQVAQGLGVPYRLIAKDMETRGGVYAPAYLGFDKGLI